MIEKKFIPDGAGKVPVEAKDHGILADHLLGVDDQLPDDANAPISGWRDVERRSPGHGDFIAVRLPGEPADYPGNSQSVVTNAILNNISGLKEHPEGWTYIGQG